MRWRELHNSDEHDRREGEDDLPDTGRGSFGTQLGRRGFLCLCEHALLVVGDDERAGETDRTRVRDSSHTPQETPSLPSPETVMYCCAIQRLGARKNKYGHICPFCALDPNDSPQPVAPANKRPRLGFRSPPASKERILASYLKRAARPSVVGPRCLHLVMWTSNLRLLRSSSAPPAPSPSFAWRTELFSPPLVVFGVEEELLPVAAGMARQLRIFFANLPS